MPHVWLVLALLVGCQVATGPVEPIWGKQACAHCMMILSDRRAAAQVQRDDGGHAYFDDIGCMMEWLTENKEPTRGRWVHQGSAWVAAESARYATGHTTPMDYGLLVDPEGMSFEAAREWVHERSLSRKEARP